MQGEIRRQEIMRLLRQRGGLVARELCEYFQVSRMTIHRDLKLLERAEQIVRLHGGVASVRQPQADCLCACSRTLLPHQRCCLQLPQEELWHCCCACGLGRLAEYAPEHFFVSDFMSGQLLSAAEAYYLLNSMAVPCCQPSILSFAAEADILNFRSGFGGALARLDEARDFLRLEQALAPK